MSAVHIDSVAWRSRWRTRSAGEKAIFYGGVVALAVTLPVVPAVPLLLVLVVCSTRPAGVSVAHLGRCLRAPMVFLCVAALSTAVSIDLENWRASVPAESVSAALAVFARAITASAAMVLFASTTPMTAVASSLRGLGVPAACVDVITVMYRMVFVLLDSLSVLRQAQAARLGYVNFRRGVSSTGLLIGAVLTRSWTQARANEIGLAGRDFGVALPMLDQHELMWRSRFAGVSVGLLTLIVVISLGTEAVW